MRSAWLPTGSAHQVEYLAQTHQDNVENDYAISHRGKLKNKAAKPNDMIFVKKSAQRSAI